MAERQAKRQAKLLQTYQAKKDRKKKAKQRLAASASSSSTEIAEHHLKETLRIRQYRAQKRQVHSRKPRRVNQPPLPITQLEQEEKLLNEPKHPFLHHHTSDTVF